MSDVRKITIDSAEGLWEPMEVEWNGETKVLAIAESRKLVVHLSKSEAKQLRDFLNTLEL